MNKTKRDPSVCPGCGQLHSECSCPAARTIEVGSNRSSKMANKPKKRRLKAARMVPMSKTGKGVK